MSDENPIRVVQGPTVAPLFFEQVELTSTDICIREMDNDRARTAVHLEVEHKKSYDKFWNNPKETPAAICERAGTKAKLFFDVSEATQGLIYLLNPAYKPLGIPEGCEVIKHDDGRRDIIDNRPKPTPAPEPIPGETAPYVPYSPSNPPAEEVEEVIE